MNKEIEKAIDCLKGNLKGFEQLLEAQPNSPVRGSIESQIDSLKTAISALEAQQDDMWIPITEQLPENKKVVLISQKSGSVALGFCNRNSGDKWRTNDGYELFNKPLAWKPLPTPYKEEQPL
jgi:hypothetical protein